MCVALIILPLQISCSTIPIRSSTSEWAANLLFFWQQRRLKLLGCIVAANGTAATSRLPLAAVIMIYSHRYLQHRASKPPSLSLSLSVSRRESLRNRRPCADTLRNFRRFFSRCKHRINFRIERNHFVPSHERERERERIEKARPRYV